VLSYRHFNHFEFRESGPPAIAGLVQSHAIQNDNISLIPNRLFDLLRLRAEENYPFKEKTTTHKICHFDKGDKIGYSRRQVPNHDAIGKAWYARQKSGHLRRRHDNHHLRQLPQRDRM